MILWLQAGQNDMQIQDVPYPTRRVEWPTLGLASLIYCLWFGATYFHESLPLWLLMILGGWSVAWQMSLQHEIIHGHPTRKRWINSLIGQWPLALWLPFENYRHSHLAHHNDERLTDPLDDPESFYWREDQWRALGAFGQALVRVQSTLLGRLAIGPLWSMLRFWKFELAKVFRGDRKTIRIVVLHVLQVAIVLVWVVGVCHMAFATYFFCFVYAGTALAMVRSFAEHRAADEVERRTAIVERSWILGPLFLFNNLHVAHHLRRNMPWYRLPGWYRLNRAALLHSNGGLVYVSYFDILRRYFVRPHDSTMHPRKAS
jgi:fatty acid desaturase